MFMPHIKNFLENLIVLKFYIEKMKNTESAGGVVINKKGLVLVVNQLGTSWSLPKGHIEEGEDKISAAKREIYEETGIKNLELVKELGSYKRYKIGRYAEEDKSEMKTIHMFLFKTDEEKLDPKDKENPIALWVEKEKVPNLLTHKKDKEFFMKIIDELSSVE